jgi:hypothetical protein
MSEHSANLVCQIGRKPTKSLANSTTRQLPGVNLDNYGSGYIFEETKAVLSLAVFGKASAR